jgi:arginine/ornithine N-succinyltransferase beta subunit
MEKLMESEFVGIADYIDSQEDWRNPEWESLNRKFFSVVVDELLEFLWEYYLPL